MRNPESQGTHQFNRTGKLIASLHQMRDRLILLEPKWLPAMLLIPLLYVLGWIICAPLVWLGLSSSHHSLAGTLTSVLLLVLLPPLPPPLMPRERQQWRVSHRQRHQAGSSSTSRRTLVKVPASECWELESPTHTSGAQIIQPSTYSRGISKIAGSHVGFSRISRSRS